MGPENTCVSMECPFAGFCKYYNFLLERGKFCKHKEQILKTVEKEIRKKEKNNE